MMKEINAIELDRNVTLTLDKELAERLDLYDNEEAYLVESDDEVVGSISCWEDGTMTFFHNMYETDTEIEELEDVESLV